MTEKPQLSILRQAETSGPYENPVLDQYGLGLPLTSEERRRCAEFDTEIFATFQHEFEHIGLEYSIAQAIELMRDTGLIRASDDYIQRIHGFNAIRGVTAKKNGSMRGVMIVAKEIDDLALPDEDVRPSVLIAAAGMIDPPQSTSRGDEKDRLYAKNVMHGDKHVIDMDHLKDRAIKWLKKSPLDEDIRTKMAEMATLMTVGYQAPIITPAMLEYMYRQAQNELSIEASPAQRPHSQTVSIRKRLGEFLDEAKVAAARYIKPDLDQADVIVITLELEHRTAPERCPHCGEELTAARSHLCEVTTPQLTIVK